MAVVQTYGGRGPKINAVCWILFFIALFFTCLRLYTRAVILKSVGADDWLTIVSILLILLYSIFISIATQYGLGQTVAEIGDMDTYAVGMKYEVLGQATLIFNIITSKSAVAMFLLRIVVVKWHRALIWAGVLVTVVLTTFATVGVIIQCLPVEATWDVRLRPTANCWINFPPVGIATSSWSIVMDFALAILPCFVIWELQMKRKEKVVVASGLSLGVFAGIAGIVRTVELTTLNNNEYLYATADMLIWSSVEVMVTIMCSSIPVLRAFYVQVFKGGKESSYKNHGSNTYGSNSRSLGHSKGYPLEDFGGGTAPGSGGKASGMRGAYVGDGMFKTNIEGTRFQTNSSEESILGQGRDRKGGGAQAGGGAHGITRTHEIVVSYGAKESRSIDGDVL